VKSVGSKLLSYVSGTLVEKRSSAISSELEVWFQNGRYVLHSPDANYSYDTLHRVFQKAFKKLSVRKLNPERVLILGFGAGSIAGILCDEMKLKPRITGIELDPEVVSLAKKYFQLERFTHLDLVITDAAQFVQSFKLTVNLLVSDVFIDKTIPEHVLSEAYVQNLVRLTAKGGLGVINMITETKVQRGQLARIKDYIQQAGATTEFFPVSSINTIVSWKK
jgi:spermidine synthase